MQLGAVHDTLPDPPPARSLKPANPIRILNADQ
jgi:hypothetical protein